MKELHRIIAGQNFTINEAKTRLQKRGSRQEVTGLTVCEKPNVTRSYVMEIRSLLYIWEKHGYDIAQSRFYPKYKAEKGHVKKGNPSLEDVLSGKLNYLKMVKGTEDISYLRLKYRFDELIQRRSSTSYIGSTLVYLDTMSIDIFQQKHSTTVEYIPLKDGKFRAYFVQEGVEREIAISKTIENVMTHNLQISLCESNKKLFYLLHKPLLQLVSLSESTEERSIDEVLSDLCNSGFDLSKLTYGTR